MVPAAGQAPGAGRQNLGQMTDATRPRRTIGQVARVLIAEDDEGIRVPLVRALEREGYEVDAVGDGLEAARLALEDGHDLLVLDIGLPSLDGLEVCRRARAAHPDVAVLFLTAQADELDAVAALDAGGDDYVTKPFRLAELLARVRAQLRRVAPEELRSGDLRLDLAARLAWQGERQIELSPKEFDLLALLMSKAGQAVRREDIMSAVWDENWFGSTKTLDMHMSWLRRKVGDDGASPQRIVTIRGVGFRFDG
jgi:DNA-binding response OmpR family regulator